MATPASPKAFERPAWQVAQVLGMQVAVAADVLEAALALKERGGGQIVTLNAEMTMAALADPGLGGAIAAADLVIPDGAGVVWALKRRVTGCGAVPALSSPVSCWLRPPPAVGAWPWWGRVLR